MKTLFYIMTVCIATMGVGQSHNLAAFDNLVGKTWQAKGTWGSGQKFFQEIDMAYSLDSAIVLVTSRGFITDDQTQLGQRNHGIRRFNPETNEVEFWEFDVFGGLTLGRVLFEGKDLIYRYPYGDTEVTDRWTYVNDSTYHFTVGVSKENRWIQKFLETQFLRIEKSP